MSEVTEQTFEVYKLDTDVVAAHIPALRAHFRQLISTGARRLHLDLSAVNMVDSSGIGLIIATHNSLKQQGGELELGGVAPEIGDLFRSMRMHQHFRIQAAE